MNRVAVLSRTQRVSCKTYITNQENFVYAQVKLDKSHNGKLSRVIHIRNIPNEVSEGEIIHLGVPFGRVTNVLVLKGKNQVSDNLSNLYLYSRIIRPYSSQFQKFDKKRRNLQLARIVRDGLCVSEISRYSRSKFCR